MPTGKARWSILEFHGEALPTGVFRVATRRGKQFNSMVHERKDSLNGAGRDAVLINAADAQAHGLRDGDRVRLSSDHGVFAGRVLVAAIKPGNLQVHWPEGNVLLNAEARSHESHVPDYNAFVRLERLRTTAEAAD
jgi:anaerobic selenocysteine-containing dehydrogenase